MYTNQKVKQFHKDESWKSVDRIEINAFMGLLLIIGRFRKSREYKNHLQRKNKALSRPIYTAIMSHNRFKDILRFIRFDDNTTREERKSCDKLAVILSVTQEIVVNLTIFQKKARLTNN